MTLYISTIPILNPDDMIGPGTRGGVGHTRGAVVWLSNGHTVVAEIDGIGRLENRVVAEVTA